MAVPAGDRFGDPAMHSASFPFVLILRRPLKLVALLSSGARVAERTAD
jgi:hypothetical protein